MAKLNTYLDTELRRGRACLAALGTVAVSACSADVMSPLPTGRAEPQIAAVTVASNTLAMLPTGSYGCGRANAMNNKGIQGGNVFTCSNPGVSHAALWVNGALVVLPSLPGTGSSNVRAIADDGTAVGFSIDSLGVPHATSWKNGVMTLLLGGVSGSAMSIGNDGVIAGSVMQGGIKLPALWVNGVLVTDAQPQGFVGAVFGARAVGVTAGTALNPINGVVRGARAFRWLGPGNYQLLNLPAGASSVALGSMNNAGTVVGVTFGASGKTSVYWPAGSVTPVSIPTPSGYSGTDLRSINNTSNRVAGSLVGQGTSTGSEPAFYNVSTGKWKKLANPDPFGAALGMNDVGMFTGTIGSVNPQPVIWQ